MKKMMIYALVAMLALVGCGDKTKPVNPNPDPEPEVGGSFSEFVKSVTRIEIEMARGHFHGIDLHADAAPKEFKYHNYTQQMTLVRGEGNQWKVADTSPFKHFVVLGGVLDGTSDTQSKYAPAYTHIQAMVLRYYDANGKELTQQLVENGARKQLQHFFVVNNDEVKPWYKSEMKPIAKPEDLYYYVYWDTDPWNKTLYNYDKTGVKMIGQEEPLGLKGWFGFLYDYVHFPIHAQLVEVKGGKKGADGKLAPCYGMPEFMKKAGSEVILTFDIPMIVYANCNSYLEVEEWDEYVELPADNPDKVLVNSLAKAYGITEREAFSELYWAIWGEAKENIADGFHL